MNANAELMDKVSDATQPAQHAVRTVTRSLSPAKATLHDGTERVRTTARHAADSTDKFVHSNPWPFIGVAVAAGAAVATLVGMRMRR